MKVTNLRLLVLSSMLGTVAMATTVVNQSNDARDLRALRASLLGSTKPAPEAAPPPKEVLPPPRIEPIEPELLPPPRVEPVAPKAVPSKPGLLPPPRIEPIGPDVEVAPMPREVKPATPAGPAPSRPDILRSRPEGFPGIPTTPKKPEPKKEEKKDKKKAFLDGRFDAQFVSTMADEKKPKAPMPAEVKPKAPVANPDILRSRPEGFPGVPTAPRVALPAPKELPAPKGKVEGDSLEKITGETTAFEQFEKIANLDLLRDPDREQIRARIADLDPRLNRATLVGRNFELLASPLFKDSIDGVFAKKNDDGTIDFVIRFKNGSHYTLKGFNLTDAEIATLFKGATVEKNLVEKLKKERGDLAVRLPVSGEFKRVKNWTDTLALLGQFRVESEGSSGFTGIQGKPETFVSWSAYRSGGRMTPAPAKSSKGAASNGKPTHDKR